MEVKPGYKQTDVGVIPQDWTATPLGEYCNIRHGFAFKSSEFCESGKYALTTPGNFQEEGGFRDVGDKQRFLSGPVPSLYVLEPEDLIVAMTEQADGLLGSVASVPRTGLYLHNQRLGRIVNVRRGCCIGYLYWAMNSPQFRRQVRETATGSKVRHTSPNKILDATVLIPDTLVEQEAIAQALSDADAAIKALENLLSKKRQIKLGAMQELLMGKRRLPGLDVNHRSRVTSELGDFPASWRPRSVESFSDFITKGSTPTTYGFSWQSSGIPFLRSECVSEWGLDLAQSMFISKEANRLLRRSEVSAGDILMTITGNVGRSIRLGAAFGKANINQHIARIRVSAPDVDASFVQHFLSQRHTRSYFERITTGQAYPQLSLTQVREFPIPLPSHEEQIQIATILSEMDNEINVIEARLSKPRAIKQAMLQELLTGRIRLI